MMKKGYARGGMKKKMMMAGGASMKKKMMSKGGKMPMNPATGKPTFVGDGIGKMAKGGAAAMYKKGYAAGGAAMKKKLTASRGTDVSSDYTSGSITKKSYPGAGKKRTGTTTKAKKPVVTKAMMAKAGVTSLRDFYNKMEVNAAGTGYKKRSKALSRTGTSGRSRKPVLGSSKNVSVGTGKGTTTMKPSKKKKAGPLGFQKFFEALSKRGGFRSD